MNRRRFLTTAGLTAGLAATEAFAHSPLATAWQDAATPDDAEASANLDQKRVGDMLYRNLGRTGERVSAIGLGGYHIGKPDDDDTAIRLIRTAIDRGINFMDNCWDYHDGRSERLMGRALQNGYRDKVFLMTKIDGRTKKAAAAQIDECLRRLRTDRIDLMQIHEIIRPHGPDVCFDEDGAVQALNNAQKAGKIRYTGFTGHKDPFVHLRMLDVARENNYKFDAVQMPLNVMDAHFRSFRRQVLPRLVTAGIAVLGMKPLGGGVLLESGKLSALECLHYALNLPTATVITGMENMDRLDQACKAVRTFQPMNTAEVARLLERAAKPAENGEYERYKTTSNYDGTAHNPHWLTATPA